MSATTMREIPQWIQHMQQQKPKHKTLTKPSLLLASASTFKITSQCNNIKAYLMLSLAAIIFQTP